jgi:DNA polymerase V
LLTLVEAANGYGYRKAGVLLMDLVQADAAQVGLWDEVDRPRPARLMEAMDAINARHGLATLKLAAEGLGDKRKAWENL